jgi:predicted transcriptional regulator YdeE
MKTVTVEAFYVIGHEARTSNAREQSGTGIIGKMWSTGVPGASPIVAVYSEYESDKDGLYNYLLGSKTGGKEKLPSDLTKRKVEAGEYVVLDSHTGEKLQVIPLWQQIWDLEREGKISRAYKTDFELYNGPAVELYVGVKRA